MTNQRFFEAAIRQSARDVGCRPEDFLVRENSFFASVRRKGAKVFYPETSDFFAVRYGLGNAVAVRADKLGEVSEALRDSDLILPEEIASLGFVPQFESICFLPAGEDVAPLECPFKTRLLAPADFSELYLPEWSNALCEKRRQCDKIAVGAYDGERLVGLAGASQDAEEMLQIGIDVIPEYRRKGIAAALTSLLAHEIIRQGQTPFYSCHWSNLPSFKNAVRAGFVPAWTEIQAKCAD